MSVNLIEMAKSYLTPDVLRNLGEASGTDPDQAEKVMGSAIPSVLAGVLQFTAWKARHLTCCLEAPGRGRTLPAANMDISSQLFSRLRSGSLRVNAPQNTPTIEQPFSSAMLSGIFGMSPAANPTTRKRPFHAMSRSAGSE